MMQRPRSRLWPPRYLRYLLIVPWIGFWRRRTRQRLSWRLAGSHFATVLASVLVICAVLTGMLVIFSRTQLAHYGEAAAEAYGLSTAVSDVIAEQPLTDPQISALLASLQTGQIAPNPNRDDFNISATIGREYRNIRAISLLDANDVIVASSDPTLIGQPSGVIDASVPRKVAVARTHVLADDRGLEVGKRDDNDGLIGVAAVRAGNGSERGILVVDKAKRSLPTGQGLVRLAASFIGAIGVTLLVAVGIPAIPVGIIVGIRRGRAIAQPVVTLATTAQRLAEGDYSARVEVKGEDEVAGLQGSFNTMADRLQSSMAQEAAERTRAQELLGANRDLIANVSHELRTPVALIRSHLEALESDPEATEAYTRIALREVDRLEHLVEDLFQLARVESRGMDLEIVPFDAGSAVREAVEALAGIARREARLTLIADVGPGDLGCLGDRERLVQVLLNLVRNAIRHTPEGGIIMVGAASVGSGVVLTVRDTGVGIAPDELPRVFERFYRAEQSRSRTTGGAGLGLTIARELIEAMGGTIAVDSVVDEGSTFTIALPCSPAPPATSTAA